MPLDFTQDWLLQGAAEDLPLLSSQRTDYLPQLLNFLVVLPALAKHGLELPLLTNSLLETTEPSLFQDLSHEALIVSDLSH